MYFCYVVVKCPAMCVNLQAWTCTMCWGESMHEKFGCFLLMHPDFSWFLNISLVICSSVTGFKFFMWCLFHFLALCTIVCVYIYTYRFTNENFTTCRKVQLLNGVTCCNTVFAYGKTTQKVYFYLLSFITSSYLLLLITFTCWH